MALCKKFSNWDSIPIVLNHLHEKITLQNEEVEICTYTPYEGVEE